MAYFYISFADKKGFRGATVVEASTPEHAVWVATKLNLNPGGEALVARVDHHARSKLIEEAKNRLMSREDLDNLKYGEGSITLRELREQFPDKVVDLSVICEDCNKPLH